MCEQENDDCEILEQKYSNNFEILMCYLCSHVKYWMSQKVWCTKLSIL